MNNDVLTKRLMELSLSTLESLMMDIETPSSLRLEIAFLILEQQCDNRIFK